MSKLFNFIDKETTRNCAGELKAEDLPIHEHHLLYYTKEQCEAMFALAQHNHDDRYYTKDDVFTKNETYQNFAPIEHYHNSLYYTKHEVYNKDTSDNKFAPKEHYHKAKDVTVSTFNFNKNLTSAENTVQKALDKIDDMDLGGGLPPYEQNKILYGKEFGNKWKPSTHLKYAENSVSYHSYYGLHIDKKINNKWWFADSRSSIYYNHRDDDNTSYSANHSLSALNTYKGKSNRTSVSFEVGKGAYFTGQCNGKEVSIKLHENQPPHFSIFNIYVPITPTTPETSFNIRVDGSIQSSFYKGQGTSPLLVNSQGVFIRSTEQVAKTATALRSLNLSEVVGSFNELFTWNDLGISAQISMPGMVQKVVSVTTVYNDNGTWKNIDNFSYQVTALGIQTSGTILRERTQIKITVLYND